MCLYVQLLYWNGTVIFWMFISLSPKIQGIFPYVSVSFLTCAVTKMNVITGCSVFSFQTLRTFLLPQTTANRVSRQHAENQVSHCKPLSPVGFHFTINWARKESEIRSGNSLFYGGTYLSPQQQDSETRSIETRGEAGTEGTTCILWCLPAPKQHGRLSNEISRLIFSSFLKLL